MWVSLQLFGIWSDDVRSWRGIKRKDKTVLSAGLFPKPIHLKISATVTKIASNVDISFFWAL